MGEREVCRAQHAGQRSQSHDICTRYVTYLIHQTAQACIQGQEQDGVKVLKRGWWLNRCPRLHSSRNYRILFCNRTFSACQGNVPWLLEKGRKNIKMFQISKGSIKRCITTFMVLLSLLKLWLSVKDEYKTNIKGTFSSDILVSVSYKWLLIFTVYLHMCER